MTVLSTPMIAQLGHLVRTRYYSAKLEGLTDQVAFEELVRVILEAYEEARSDGDGRGTS